jgi:hypothetical protein
VEAIKTLVYGVFHLLIQAEPILLITSAIGATLTPKVFKNGSNLKLKRHLSNHLIMNVYRMVTGNEKEGLTPTEHMNEELNKYIATEIMGLCWHEWEVVDAPHPCLKCGETQSWRERFIEARPDYCSSLDLVAGVEKVVIEKVGSEYVMALCEIGQSNVTNERDGEMTDTDVLCALATATALQRARACEKAHKLAMEGK